MVFMFLTNLPRPRSAGVLMGEKELKDAKVESAQDTRYTF